MGRNEELGEIAPGRRIVLLKTEGVSPASEMIPREGVGLTVLGRGGSVTGVKAPPLLVGEVRTGKGEGMRKRLKGSPSANELVSGI